MQKFPDARVLDEGSPVKGRYTVAWILRMDAGAPSRAGAIVSKRTFHDAVDRNRAKRLLREAFFLECANMPQGFAWVLIARRAIAGRKCQDVRRDLRDIARKAAEGRWSPKH
ncbi:MAG: ribonuclease P protein component [Kiritimatiellae bacterium]|nr:ribonuclease P protein component [Kiritimatiellia bacterium]